MSDLIDDARKKITDRVRAMLAKAASTEHEGEREAFEAKAEQMIARYQIENAELADIQPIQKRTYFLNNWGNATMGVANSVALLAGLHQGDGAINTERGWDGKLVGHVVIYIRDQDWALLETRLDYLLPQLRAQMTRDKPRSRKSYAIVWGQTVTARIKEAQAVAYSNSNALVPTNTEANRVMHENEDLVDRRDTIDPRSANSGAIAGNQTDLGQGRLK